MKRPLEVLTKIKLENLAESKNNIIFNFNQIDKILVWIVGFSITGISIIVSNIADLNSKFEIHILKTILLLLCISIISGIIYRLAALIYLSIFQKILFYLKGSFSNYEMTPIKSDIIDPENINEVYQKIKKGFDIDYSDVVENYNKYESNEIKEKSLLLLNKEYKRLTEQAKKEEEFTEDFINTTFRKVFGISEKRLEKTVYSSNDTFFLKFWNATKIVMLFACVFCFISTIVILTSNYK
ncbi:hypothetical protein ACFO3O_06140 [Dokdonia ponticola]|uniref:SMODS and SLOG-associating 2TM effector domain-containing protein n=1 Tax=Dokdonia ponticola TaxID=2041041 RepID=A0ABV9HUD4_9FLAO